MKIRLPLLVNELPDVEISKLMLQANLAFCSSILGIILLGALFF